MRKLLAEVPVSDAFVSRLTARENLTPAQIANALRFAHLVQAEEAGEVEGWMERQLQHADLALGHRPQHLIAAFVAQVVVDGFETVQVEVKQGDRVALSLGL